MAIVLLVVGLAAGFGGGYLITQPTINDLTARSNALRTDLTAAEDRNRQLEAQVTSTRADLEAAQAALTSSQERVQELSANVQQAQEQLVTVQEQLVTATGDLEALRTRLTEIDEAVTRLEADRLVLIELRRDRGLMEFPDPSDSAAVGAARADLRAFWENVRSLAVTADTSLTPALDRVITRIDPWLDWIEQFPINGTLEDLGRWYNDGGLGGFFEYFTAVDEFESQLNLIVITHVDRVAGLTD